MNHVWNKGARALRQIRSDLFEAPVKTEQVGQDIHFATERTVVLAHQVEPDFARSACGQTKRK